MSKRPFRFGVWAENAHTPAQLLDTACRAEGSGFSTLLIRDHLIEGPFPDQFGPLTALAFVAARTTTLRVGTMVISNDFRHPAVLAKEVATLDVLSEGRAELGLGAGFLRMEYEQTGMAFDDAGTRVDRLEEALDVLKGLFSPGPFEYRGRHYRIEGLESFPVPAQRPHPPILVAGSRRRMLSLAARQADIVAIQPVSTGSGDVVDDSDARSPERLQLQLGWIRDAAEGRLSELELSSSATIVVAHDRTRAAAELALSRNWAVTPEQVLEMPSVFIGSEGQVSELFEERRERFGLSYFVMTDLALDAARPLVARLAGR
jgi:probable F420-dependent oxidoreductase